MREVLFYKKIIWKRNVNIWTSFKGLTWKLAICQICIPWPNSVLSYQQVTLFSKKIIPERMHSSLLSFQKIEISNKKCFILFIFMTRKWKKMHCLSVCLSVSNLEICACERVGVCIPGGDWLTLLLQFFCFNKVFIRLMSFFSFKYLLCS